MIMDDIEALIIKNITHEDPGLISEILSEYDIGYNIVDISKTVRLPDIDQYKLIIIMGGPDSANDTSEKILKELDYVKQAIKKRIPIFGVCLGLQLMVKAMGGEVYRNPVQEIGFKSNDTWYLIKLTDEGLKDPIINDLPKEFKVFQLHGETVKLTDDCKLLGTGEFCENQIIKFGDFNYGFQFHFELTDELMNKWIDLAPELKGENSIQLLRDYKQVKDSLKEVGEKIFRNFLNLLSFKNLN